MPTVIDGTTGVSQIQAGATSDGLPVFQCRAWVNFDGTRDAAGNTSTANTARFIRASGNVSSVVRNGAGDYTVNFTTAMPDTNYCTLGTATSNRIAGVFNWAGSFVRVNTRDNADTPQDNSLVSVSIFR